MKMPADDAITDIPSLDTGKAAAAAEPAEMHLGIRVRQTVRHNPIMRLTARNMLGSHTTTAPVTVTGEADAAVLVRLRETLAARPAGPKITYSHLLIRLLAAALARHPELNAAYVEDSVKIYDEINIGMATTLPDGNLVVPVIRNADALTVDEIATRAVELAERVRAGRIRLEDVQCGTFTLSNGGMLPAIRWTTPLLNPPQVAILATGAIVKRAAVHNTDVEPQTLLGLSLTFDHRALNGFAASRFVQTMADMIADPQEWLGLTR